MSQRNVAEHDRRKPEKPDFSYKIHGCVAPIGYFKVVQNRTLKHVLLYNRTTQEHAKTLAGILANELLGRVLNGSEFCRG